MIQKKKKKSEKNPFTWFQYLWHSCSNQGCTHWQRNTLIDQRNRINRPGTDPHRYAQLIFQRFKQQLDWQKIVYQTNGVGANGCKKGINLDLSLILYPKINSKQITKLNVKDNTASFRENLEEWEKYSIWHQNFTLAKENLINSLHKFCKLLLCKRLLRGWRDKLQSRRKYLQTTYYTKYWYLECIAYSQNSMVRKQTTRLEKRQKTWADISLKRLHRWQTSTWKDIWHHHPSQKFKPKACTIATHLSGWLKFK